MVLFKVMEEEQLVVNDAWQRMRTSMDDLDPDHQERLREVLQKLAERIRRLRKESGVSGAQFAKVIGISYPTLVGIETGTVNVTMKMIYVCSEALGVKMSELLEGLDPTDLPDDGSRPPSHNFRISLDLAARTRRGRKSRPN